MVFFIEIQSLWFLHVELYRNVLFFALLVAQIVVPLGSDA